MIVAVAIKTRSPRSSDPLSSEEFGGCELFDQGLQQPARLAALAQALMGGLHGG